jgi:hypothetical protein
LALQGHDSGHIFRRCIFKRDATDKSLAAPAEVVNPAEPQAVFIWVEYVRPELALEGQAKPVHKSRKESHFASSRQRPTSIIVDPNTMATFFGRPGLSSASLAWANLILSKE